MKMTSLVDTNVISELTRAEPDPGVLEWARSIHLIALSTVSVEEIYFGLSRKANPRILAWFESFVEQYCEILPVTATIAAASGRIRGKLQSKGSTRAMADMMIAATAHHHHLTLVTRNIRDFRGCGIPLLNPFS